MGAFVLRGAEIVNPSITCLSRNKMMVTVRRPNLPHLYDCSHQMRRQNSRITEYTAPENRRLEQIEYNKLYVAICN
jgi:hypothetical protein